ncbi:hypothetical protein M1L60_33815 [Actinoplanes sp. TRM 88003]|uniref:Uncharacterized protein n=1 Tax=Paractinoplanes aksuensis TaxID=2939490 RepID=A0ABT1DXI3_9ACTN|nr:hypothetical protein [Actinoplanes aksuensis]MCO8275574.1 hypothetical protein [Actinoplanes aksuensis]
MRCFRGAGVSEPVWAGVRNILTDEELGALVAVRASSSSLRARSVKGLDCMAVSCLSVRAEFRHEQA